MKDRNEQKIAEFHVDNILHRDTQRWLGLALAAIAIHQLQSVAVEPEERRFRTTVLGAEAIMAASAMVSLPPTARRVRGTIWSLLAIGPILGAWIGHLHPIVRGRPIPPATETAPLNLAGGALLLAMGLREVNLTRETVSER